MNKGLQDDAARLGPDARVTCVSRIETQDLARYLASQLRVGDVVLLDGALAAGKTTFVTQICRALDCEEQPSSPTYAISNVYTCPQFEIFHIDAYRLDGPRAFQNLGLDEFFPESLALIEWGERVAAVFPDSLHVRIGFLDGAPDARHFDFAASGGRWQSLLADLARYGREQATDAGSAS
ncbi:tRNA (adenosine(37)-N6)-threonylcarbamoyltransferase complex ATPase subunit type 1 TsaE [Puniceibacterium confluentis]|uniref:tRNA (adenosine(37)-N6)-threonylcarbamoyltransferase complex ATPase subunit type 1 TsaE n=1 Tax=Puniceibacterium confluentis TaxID=1958944 RepID=UPI0011B7A4E3|nr:tRNA (adenosine(37)-N6)-threonylcarbamoyltransferase complex ATPase subunit type 1 TsaE [Puniceibacterium confluentis]